MAKEAEVNETPRLGVKYGIIAPEKSGKTMLIGRMVDTLVVSTDNKAFKGKTPHFRVPKYEGFKKLIDTIGEKLDAYEAKYGKLPRNLVIDSVTHLANNMEKHCKDKYTGWAQFDVLGKDIMAFNAFLEDDILPLGINVIFTSHCQFDQNENRYVIASPGNFGKNGSWLSVTDEASFIEMKSGKRVIHHYTMKYPCRTHHYDTLPESEDCDTFDINAHIEMLESSNHEASEWAI